MNGLLIGLAEMNPEDLPGVKGWPANGQLDVFVVIGAVALIILLALIGGHPQAPPAPPPPPPSSSSGVAPMGYESGC